MMTRLQPMRKAAKYIALVIALGGVRALAVADQGATPAPSTAPANTLENEQIETEFTVRRGVLKMIKGSKSAGQADRQFIAGALGDRKVSLRNCDYHALVISGQASPTEGNTAKPLRLQVVMLDTLSCRNNPTVADYIKELSGTEFRRDAVSFYEHPTTCYDFIADAKLTLMCHYGSASYAGIDLAPVVTYLKQHPRN
jgi:hypothetical protein